MSETGEVKLEYAMRGPDFVHVSDFDHLRRSTKDRPTDLACPECDSRVCAVLGEQVSDHFRHVTESGCGLGGESALHFNAKVSLALEMGKYRRASLVYRCRICSNWYSFLQIGPYDRVVPEMKVAARRPDVSCLSGGTVVGIAEILKTHAVNFEKKNDLNAIGCPWFEIPAINVHRQFFKFIEAADVFSIDAIGAGVTYPMMPRVCEACAPEAERRSKARLGEDERTAKNWLALERSSALQPAGGDTGEYEEWRKLAERRRAETLRAWNEYKTSPDADPAALRMGARLQAEGIIPEADQWGVKPSTPRLDNLTYVRLVNERKKDGLLGTRLQGGQILRSRRFREKAGV